MPVVKFELTRRKVANWEAQVERLPPDLLIPTLDIGSGNSPLIFKIPGSMTMNLKKHRPERGSTRTFMSENPQPDIVGDASEKIPLPNQSVGRVTMHHVIGPHDDPYARANMMSGVITPDKMRLAAREVRRVLVDGGKLYIYSGHLEDIDAVKAYRIPLRDAGFTDIEFSTSKHNIDDEHNSRTIYEESLYEEVGTDKDQPRRQSFGGLIIATK